MCSLQAHKQALQHLLLAANKVCPAAKRALFARQHKAAQVALQRTQRRHSAAAGKMTLKMLSAQSSMIHLFVSLACKISYISSSPASILASYPHCSFAGGKNNLRYALLQVVPLSI